MMFVWGDVFFEWGVVCYILEFLWVVFVLFEVEGFIECIVGWFFDWFDWWY